MQRFFKDSFIYSAGGIMAGVLNYLFQFAVSRLLSVGQYGELQSLFAVFSVAGIFGAALSYFVIKYSSVFAKFKDYRACEEFVRSMSPRIKKTVLISLFLFLLVSPLLLKFLHLSDLWGLVAIGLAAAAGTMAVLYSGILNGWQRFLDFNLVSVASSLSKLVVGFALVKILPTASMAAASLLAASIVSWYFAKHFVNKKIFTAGSSVGPAIADPTSDPDSNPNPAAVGQTSAASAPGWKEKYFPDTALGKLTAHILVFTLLYTLLGNADILLVKALTSPETTGYYGVLSLLGKIILFVNAAVIAVVLSHACADSHNGGVISRKLLWSAYGLISAVGVAGLALYYTFPYLVIRVFFGLKYTEFASDLWLFALMALIFSFVSLEANIAYAKHDFRVSYVLGLSVVAMSMGIWLFHGSLREVVLAVSAALTLGLVGMIALNLFGRGRLAIKEEASMQMLPPEVN